MAPPSMRQCSIIDVAMSMTKGSRWRTALRPGFAERHRTRYLATSAIVLALAATACSTDDESARSPEELAAILLTAEDLEGQWGEPTRDTVEAIVSGVVTDEQRELLPTVDLCETASAESRATARALAPLAFRQLDLTVDDPIEPPDDREGHLVFTQQFMFSAQPDEIESTFESLVAGFEACLGEFPADEEGPGRTVEFELPALGDDRYATLTTLEEAGGWAEWMIYDAIVRDGSTLMNLVVIDIRAGDDPLFSDSEIADIVARAVDKW